MDDHGVDGADVGGDGGPSDRVAVTGHRVVGRVDDPEPESAGEAPEEPVDAAQRQPLDVHDVGSRDGEPADEERQVERMLEAAGQPAERRRQRRGQRIGQPVERLADAERLHRWESAVPEPAGHELDPAPRGDERVAQGVVVRAGIAARVDEDDPHQDPRGRTRVIEPTPTK